MNFRRKMVYTAISCTLILAAVLFTVISIVSFNSQDASAAPYYPGMNKVAIKIKVNLIKIPEIEAILKKDREKATKEAIKANLVSAMKDTNLQVVPYDKEHPKSEWTIYFLINQEHDTVDMSITLTHHDRFVMNHIKAICIDVVADPEPIIVDMIEMVANVIQQKMKNKDAPIIVTDKSTIAN